MRDTATFSEAIFNTLIWVLLFIALIPGRSKPYLLSKGRKLLVFFLLLLFCLFPFFGGDYFHYLEYFRDVKQGFTWGIEEVYVWLITNSPSYTFFRLTVWGPALLLTLMAYKRIAPLDNLSLSFFSLLYLLWFSYARVSLAMAIIFWGLCLMAKPFERRKIISYILGLVIICCSVFFHRSALIGVIAAVGSLFMKNINKKFIIFVISFFPFLVVIMKLLLSEFLTFDLDYETFVTSQHRDIYLSEETNDSLKSGLSLGVGPYISVFLTRLPLFLVAISYGYSVVKGYYNHFIEPARIISSYSFIIILIAFAFSLDLGVSTYVFYYRTLNFAMIPSAVFLAQVKIQGKMSRTFKLIYFISLLGVVYTLIYTIYSSIVS